MFIIQHFVHVFYMLSLSVGVVSDPWADVKDSMSNFVSDFSNYASIRPVSDSSSALNVSIDMNIVSINDFDEPNGYLEISGYLTIEWDPEIYINESLFPSSTTETVLMRNSDIWKPPILLVNSLKRTEEIGSDSSIKVRYNFQTMHCEWRPWIVVRGSCTADVQYYPFDKQSCVFKFAAWGYTQHELTLTPTSSELFFSFFEENGEWEVGETSAAASVQNNISMVEFGIQLTRRPLYYVINLVSPVILLGFLNSFVFFLPAESGERIGFSITCFLSYVVLLNMIMGFLPTSALPLSYLCYYTFVMMVFSGFMSLATIFTLRVFHKPEHEHVPVFLAFIVKIFTCHYCKSGYCSKCHNKNRTLPNEEIHQEPHNSSFSVNKHDSRKTVPNKHIVVNVKPAGEGSKETEQKKHTVTWKLVAHLLDRLFFFGFLGGQIFYSVSYLVPMVLNEG